MKPLVKKLTIAPDAEHLWWAFTLHEVKPFQTLPEAMDFAYSVASEPTA